LKYPGKFEEQPIPLTVRISWGLSPSSEQAFCRQLRTPKSPQPGHQSGSTFPLKSFGFISTGSWTAVSTDMSLTSSLNHDLLSGDKVVRLAGQLLQNTGYDVMRHEGLSIVLADMPVY